VRIVQLVETLEVGGLERVAVDLALAQHGAGHQVSVYCLFAGGPLRKELDGHGIPVREFRKTEHSNATVVWSIARQLRGDRVEVVHGHNPGVHHAAAVAKVLAGAPVCVNTRHSAANSQGVAYQERYFRLVEPLTDHVVFVCEEVRNRLLPRLRYRPEKCSVIWNGVATERFLKRPASPGALRPRIRFGTVGRLVPAKGHAVLIEAFAKVAGQLPGAELHIYGYGPLERELRDLAARLGMEGRIALEGPAGNSAAAFESLDLFVLSSLNEGLPLVIMEAMAAGLPVVSTRVGGVPEVAPEHLAAWFCEPGDADGLARAMAAAAGSGELEARGAEARRLASQYDIARMSARYEALYDRLLGCR
jgi:glycosyltransferase involved in cell wall biosynthesis